MKRRSKKFIIAVALVLGVSVFVDQVGATYATKSATTIYVPTKEKVATTTAKPLKEASTSASPSPELQLIQERQQSIRESVAHIHAERIQRRFEYYYNRLSLLGMGLENQLGQLEDQGIETATASAELTEAQAELEAAKLIADEASEAYNQINATDFETQVDQSYEARELTQSAKNAFGEVLQMFKQVVQKVKAL